MVSVRGISEEKARMLATFMHLAVYAETIVETGAWKRVKGVFINEGICARS
jgi:hypothetical protein